MHSITREVRDYILKHDLISCGDTVICGFSGGADSMCMLEILHILSKQMCFETVAVHLNHSIREEADTDESVCKEFCEKRNIRFYSKKVDIKKLSAERKCGEEETGRAERYAYFSQIAEKYENSVIATAHTKNDLAETVLHRVIRGSSIKGLVGIRPKRDNIIRPILGLSRSQIEQFCKYENLPYVTDKTNFETVYTRNKIRLDILPALKNININIVDALAVLAENSSVDSDYIDKNAQKAYKEIVNSSENCATVSIEKLMSFDAAIRRRIIIKMTEVFGIAIEHKHVLAIEEMCRIGKTGKNCDIPGGYATVEYKNLKIGKDTALQNAEFYMNATSGKTFTIGDYDVCVTVFEDAENTVVVVRSRVDGDKIILNGMTKKLKQVFIDLKIPRQQRDEIPIIEINGEVVAVGDFIKSDSLKKFKDKIKVSVNKRHI